MAIHFDCMWQSPLQVGVGQWLNSNWWNVCESGTYHIQAAHYPLYVILTFSPHLLAVRVILRSWLFKGNRTNCKMEEIWVPEWHSPLLLICTGIKHECERNFFVMKPIKIWDCLLKQLPCCNTESTLWGGGEGRFKYLMGGWHIYLLKFTQTWHSLFFFL